MARFNVDPAISQLAGETKAISIVKSAAQSV